MKSESTFSARITGALSVSFVIFMSSPLCDVISLINQIGNFFLLFFLNSKQLIIFL